MPPAAMTVSNSTAGAEAGSRIDTTPPAICGETSSSGAGDERGGWGTTTAGSGRASVLGLNRLAGVAMSSAWCGLSWL
jgi:hypothetical protein